MSSKVFLSQEPAVAPGKQPPDFSAAHQFGEVVVLLGKGQWAALGDAAFNQIQDLLDRHEFDPEQDYLIATGDMVLGVQVAVCMIQRGGCRMLRYDRERDFYYVYNVVTGESIYEC